MRNLRPALIVACVLLCSSSFVNAQVHTSLVSDADARRYGLTRDWYTQVSLDGSQGRLTQLAQFVSQKQKSLVYEISTPTGREYISEKDLDRFGEPLGTEGVRKQADERAKQLREKGIEAKVTPCQVPAITLVATTSRGNVHVLDGHTGRTLWANVFGDPDFPTLKASASDKYVAAVNGSTLFLAARDTGRTIWERKLGGAPGAGPAVTDDFVFVPLVNGMMEVYSTSEPRKPPAISKSHGRALIEPTLTAVNVSWPTDRGFMYVARRSDGGLRFRLEADDTITSPISVRDPLFLYATAHDGFVYCVHQRAGDVAWRFSTGDTVSQQALVVEDALYVVTDGHDLYCLNSETGQQNWVTSGISHMLGASPKRLYVLNNTGRFTILDAKTGGVVGTLPFVGTDLHILNTATDRLFLATTGGMIQCLREVDLELPVVHNLYSETVAADAGAKPLRKRAGGAEGDAAHPNGAGPMGEPVDPFGGAVAPKAKAGGEPADPFAPPPAAGGAMKAEEKKPADVNDPFAPPPAAGGAMKPEEKKPADNNDPFAVK